MGYFSKKIAQQSEDLIYHIQKEDWDSQMDLHSYLIAVPLHKQKAFEKAINGTSTIRAEDFGRVIYNGTGELNARLIDEILQKSA